jgi:hypothetical protein
MSNIIFPRSKFLDTNGNISKEWQQWLQNPQFATFSIVGTLDVSAGGTGIGTTPGPGQILVGNGLGYSLTTLGAGTGLTVTNGTGTVSVKLSDTATTAGTFGSSSRSPVFTVNQQGQLTACSDTPIAITSGQVSGLGTMATQNSTSVSVTGGSVDGTVIGGSTPANVTAATLQSTGSFGANNATPQTPAASGGAVAATGATNVVPYGFTTAAQANAIITLLNNIRASLVANGIMS